MPIASVLRRNLGSLLLMGAAGLCPAPRAALLAAETAAPPAAEGAVAAAPGTVAGMSVKDAIAKLRSVNPADAEEVQALRDDPQIRTAWRAIVSAGAPALAELDAAVKTLAPAGGADDAFRVTAGALYWRLGGAERAADAAALWSAPGLDLSRLPTIVYAIAYQAAQTRDPRVLPLLLAALGDTQSEVSLQTVELDLAWPETVEFIWSAYGPGGLPALAALLAREGQNVNDGQLASAALLLAAGAHTPALPAIRALAADPNPEHAISRIAAIEALGLFGHPDDFDFLADGLARRIGENNPDLEADAFATALVDYADPRAAAPLLDYLDLLQRTEYEDPRLGLEERQSLRAVSLAMATPETLARLRGQIEALAGPERADADALLSGFFVDLGVAAADYDQADAAAQARYLTDFRRQFGLEAAAPAAGEASAEAEAALSRENALQALADMREAGVLAMGEEEEEGLIPPALLLAALTPADIPALLELKAVLATRLEEATLEDFELLSAMVLQLARREYRQ